MVQKYINSLYLKLIDKHDYLPIRDPDGNFVINEYVKVLHRFKNNANIIIDLVNGDTASAYDIESKLENNRRMFNSYSSKGEFYFYTVFVFYQVPEKEKTDLLNSIQSEKYGNIKDISCMSIIMSTKEVTKHFKVPPTTFGLDRVFEKLLVSGEYQNEVLPDVNELVNRKLEGFKIEFKTKAPVATYIILAINIAIYAISNLLSNYNILLSFGAQINSLIREGEYWRFITPIFLHAGIVHLFMNSYFLYSIGKTVESMYGSAKFVFIYMTAGIIGNIASFVFLDNWSVGASGALMGMLGALLYYGVENPSQFKRYFGYNVISTIVINAIFGFTNEGINNYAHFGGLLGGFLASGIVSLGKPNNKYFNRYTAIPATLITATAGLLYGFLMK